MVNKRSSDEFKIDINNKEMIHKIASYIVDEMKSKPGMSVQQAIGISDEALEEIYALAYNFYNQGKYQEAGVLFEFLSGVSPKTYKFLLGLGSCHYQMEAYEDAFAGFLLALMVECTDPLPGYYAVECCIKRECFEEAQELIGITQEICGDRPEYAALKARCDLIRESLKNKK